MKLKGPFGLGPKKDKRVYWSSPLEDKCQTCSLPFGDTMYDMKTVHGPWANMCHSCAMHGHGIGKVGLGFGQKYEKQPDGKWLKTEG